MAAGITALTRVLLPAADEATQGRLSSAWSGMQERYEAELKQAKHELSVYAMSAKRSEAQQLEVDDLKQKLVIERKEVQRIQAS